MNLSSIGNSISFGKWKKVDPKTKEALNKYTRPCSMCVSNTKCQDTFSKSVAQLPKMFEDIEQDVTLFQDKSGVLRFKATNCEQEPKLFNTSAPCYQHSCSAIINRAKHFHNSLKFMEDAAKLNSQMQDEMNEV